MEAYRFENIEYSYNGYDTKALTDVTFSVNKGDFIVVCGPSGSGKSTLLKCLKENHSDFGYVMQNPSSQIVTDNVMHEMAFGLENKGVSPDKMRQKIAEMATYFGLGDLLHRKTFDLSGGEKQLVNLASILVMDPEVILLDEPTSQLDPMAATEFLEILKRINSQLGITIILVEQRLEDVLSVCDKMLLLDHGKIVAYDSLTNVFESIRSKGLIREYLPYFPSYVRLYENYSEDKGSCPKSVKECKQWFMNQDFILNCKPIEMIDYSNQQPSIECKHIFFRYEKKADDIIQDVSFKAYPGQIVGIVGGNGSGKSTLLKLITGALKCYHGKISVSGKVAYMPQDPKFMFVEETIANVVTDQESVHRFGLETIVSHHPYDVSGGQMQRVAMAYLDQMKAQIYLFDEPTKGMDPFWKRRYEEWIQELRDLGKTVLIVSHDVEFVANCCDCISLCFDSHLSSKEMTRDFLRNNFFYTTAIHRIVRDRYPEIVSERCINES